MGTHWPGQNSAQEMAASHNRFLHWFVALTAAIGFLPVILNTRTAFLGLTVGSMSLLMTIWVWLTGQDRAAKIVATVTVGVAIAGSAAGPLLSVNARWLGMVQACASQTAFALLVSVTILTSDSGQRGVQAALDDGWPSLRSLSFTAAGLVLVDSMFGAAFRHQLLGPVLHIAGAMAGTVVVVMLSIFILTQHSDRESLRQSALALLLVTSFQMILGIADYMVRLPLGASKSWSTGLLSTLHSAAGALALAACAAVTIQVSRNVRKPAALRLSSPHSFGAI